MQTKFSDEKLAVLFLESLFWPEGPTCCEKSEFWTLDNHKIHRPGLRKCKVCRTTFTVRRDTLFNGSKLPLYKCLRAVVLVCRLQGVTNQALSKDLSIDPASAAKLKRRIMEADESQRSPLVHALGRSVAEPLRLDPTVEITPSQLIGAPRLTAPPMIAPGVRPQAADTMPSGVATVPGS